MGPEDSCSINCILQLCCKTFFNLIKDSFSTNNSSILATLGYCKFFGQSFFSCFDVLTFCWVTQNGLVKCHEQSTVLCLGLIEGRFQSTSSKPAKSVTRGTETDPKQVRFSVICTFFLFVGEGGGGWGKVRQGGNIKQQIFELTETWLVVIRELWLNTMYKSLLFSL